jgi:hypothetical protein
VFCKNDTIDIRKIIKFCLLVSRGNTSGKTEGKTQGNTYIFIRKYQKISGNTKKYQEIPKNFRKYLEISDNTCKFQEILVNIRKYYEIPGNTRPKT